MRLAPPPVARELGSDYATLASEILRQGARPLPPSVTDALLSLSLARSPELRR